MRGPFHPEVPFSPRRAPFFYGWVVVGAATLGLFASIPGQTMGVSVFNDALIDATGLTRLAVANAYLAGTVASGLCLPWGGTLLDRFGARQAIVAASIGLGVMLVLLSHVDHLAPSGAEFVVLAALFFGLRFSGQGMLAMTSRTTMARWFERIRGLVAGVSGVFVGFAFGYAPRLFDAWIERAGWRGAWREMALIVGVGFAFIAWLFFRNRPEECGLTLDGDPPKEKRAEAAEEEPSKTRRQALRTVAFWAVTICLSSQALIITGVTFHIVDIGAKVGLERAAAVAVFLPMAVVSTTTGFFGGALADRVRVRTLLALFVVAQTLGLVGAAYLETGPILFMAGFGISGGLFGPIAQVAYPRYFGRQHLGAIAGAQMMAVVLGSAVGPSLLAVSERLTGSYGPALLDLIALPVVGAALALRMEREPS